MSAGVDARGGALAREGGQEPAAPVPAPVHAPVQAAPPITATPVREVYNDTRSRRSLRVVTSRLGALLRQSIGGRLSNSSSNSSSGTAVALTSPPAAGAAATSRSLARRATRRAQPRQFVHVPLCLWFRRKVPFVPTLAMHERVWQSLVREAAAHGVDEERLLDLFHQVCSATDFPLGTVVVEKVYLSLDKTYGYVLAAKLKSVALGASRIRFEAFARVVLEMCAAGSIDLLQKAARLLRTGELTNAAELRVIFGHLVYRKAPTLMQAIILQRAHDDGFAHTLDALVHYMIRYPSLAMPLLYAQASFQRQYLGRPLWQEFQVAHGLLLFPIDMDQVLADTLSARTLLLECASHAATPFELGTPRTRVADGVVSFQSSTGSVMAAIHGTKVKGTTAQTPGAGASSFPAASRGALAPAAGLGGEGTVFHASTIELSSYGSDASLDDVDAISSADSESNGMPRRLFDAGSDTYNDIGLRTSLNLNVQLGVLPALVERENEDTEAESRTGASHAAFVQAMPEEEQVFDELEEYPSIMSLDEAEHEGAEQAQLALGGAAADGANSSALVEATSSTSVRALSGRAPPKTQGAGVGSSMMPFLSGKKMVDVRTSEAGRKRTAAMLFGGLSQRLRLQRQERGELPIPGSRTPVIVEMKPPPRQTSFLDTFVPPNGVQCTETSLALAMRVLEHAAKGYGTRHGVHMCPCLLCGRVVKPYEALPAEYTLLRRDAQTVQAACNAQAGGEAAPSSADASATPAHAERPASGASADGWQGTWRDALQRAEEEFPSPPGDTLALGYPSDSQCARGSAREEGTEDGKPLADASPRSGSLSAMRLSRAATPADSQRHKYDDSGVARAGADVGGNVGAGSGASGLWLPTRLVTTQYDAGAETVEAAAATRAASSDEDGIQRAGIGDIGLHEKPSFGDVQAGAIQLLLPNAVPSPPASRDALRRTALTPAFPACHPVPSKPVPVTVVMKALIQEERDALVGACGGTESLVRARLQKVRDGEAQARLDAVLNTLLQATASPHTEKEDATVQPAPVMAHVSDTTVAAARLRGDSAGAGSRGGGRDAPSRLRSPASTPPSSSSSAFSEVGETPAQRESAREDAAIAAIMATRATDVLKWELAEVEALVDASIASDASNAALAASRAAAAEKTALAVHALDAAKLRATSSPPLGGSRSRSTSPTRRSIVSSAQAAESKPASRASSRQKRRPGSRGVDGVDGAVSLSALSGAGDAAAAPLMLDASRDAARCGSSAPRGDVPSPPKPPKRMKTRNTGFCVQCDEFVWRAAADYFGFKLASQLLRAAETVPTGAEEVELQSAAARKDGHRLLPVAKNEHGQRVRNTWRVVDDVWVKLLDEASRAWFFYNPATGESTWQQPAQYYESTEL